MIVNTNSHVVEQEDADLCDGKNKEKEHFILFTINTHFWILDHPISFYLKSLSQTTFTLLKSVFFYYIPIVNIKSISLGKLCILHVYNMWLVPRSQNGLTKYFASFVRAIFKHRASQIQKLISCFLLR